MAAFDKKMSILMTADTVGGVWTYALELVKALQSHDITVHLATMGRQPTASQRKEAARLRNLELHSSSYKLEWMDQPWEEVDRAGAWLLELEKELRPDVIHLNNYCHGQLKWQAPVLMVGHSCVLSWWKAVKGEEAPDAYATYAQKVGEGLQAADIVVAPTKAYLQQLLKYYGPFRQATVVANSRDFRAFKPGIKKDMVLSVGRLWDEAKNIKSCEMAAERLEWPIEVAGDSQHPSNGQETSYEHLVTLGKLKPEEVAARMANASIYVMPAKYEPFGLSILEAALSGCALVLGDIPSLRENWQGVALFADPDNPEDICEKLLFLSQQSQIRERMGFLARERAMEFSLNYQATAYRHLYLRLIQNKKSNENSISKDPRQTAPNRESVKYPGREMQGAGSLRI